MTQEIKEIRLDENYVSPISRIRETIPLEVRDVRALLDNFVLHADYHALTQEEKLMVERVRKVYFAKINALRDAAHQKEEQA